MSTSTNNLSTWLPQYLHLFNFPSHITPETLLNLEPNKTLQLEENLFVCYRHGRERIPFSNYLEFTNSEAEHNPYGPSTLWSDGEHYTINGKYHRLDGPAYIVYGKTKYYLNDVYYPDELSFYLAVTQYKTLHNLL